MGLNKYKIINLFESIWNLNSRRFLLYKKLHIVGCFSMSIVVVMNEKQGISLLCGIGVVLGIISVLTILLSVVIFFFQSKKATK
jgi:hypothetical protein